MNQPDADWTLFQQLINRSPQLSSKIERVAAYVQGKGFGAATIEQEIKHCIQLLGRPPSLAVDIGGNIGDYTAELRSSNPEAEIHLFEPSATNMKHLRRRFDGDSAVHVMELAVSDQAGEATLFANNPGSALASLTKRRLEHFGIPFEAMETVTTIRFEQYWIETLQRRRIDLAKLDVEGHELAALVGFGDAIGAARLIQFEFGGCNIDTRTFFQDFWYFFKERNFALYRIGPFGLESLTQYREADEFFSTTNYLALNRNLG